MSQNLVSLTLTHDQVTAALTALDQVEASLPGLISLQPEDRKGLVFMGPRSEAFCRQTVRVLDQNRQIVPPSLDLGGAQADLVAIDQLRPVLERLQRLLSRVDDTVNALGSDVMVTALEGYGQLKLSGAAHGLDELRKEVGARWSRQRRSNPAETQPA
ncbi:hypothetical protein J2X06_003328 [Lysobacter niastensis]|uniref:Uncharacterized protein n=1 Tax=Lysobacter niastensis TaxID=380629 RepID=A0ABU1WFC8_9GAMM|nr:hypothetical protein [Lysobacter niastensis]MDR7136110.1 hypothetical protein [Lysobacter niastensis]